MQGQFKKGLVTSLKNEYIPMLFASIFVGIVVGLVVGLFNFVGRLLVNNSTTIYLFMQQNPVFIPCLFIALVCIAVLMYFIHKHNAAVRGGGLPQAIAMCKGEVKYSWWKVLWANITCSFMSFACGLPVGAEGPSMFVGAAAADGVHKTTKMRPYTNKYLLTAGASSGLAATFNAPLAGIVFSIEKMHRKFSPLLLFVVGIAVICSTLTINLISLLWGGTSTFFDFSFLLDIPMQFYWCLLILGVVIGISAVLFQLLLIKTQKFLDGKTKQFPYWLRLICAFVATGIVGLLLVDATTGGHLLIEKIVAMDFAVVALLILLVVKVILIAICYNSGATGGLFIPSLSIGALVGGLMGHLFVVMGMPPELYATIVCFAMLAFLGGVGHAPISSLILLLEITAFSGNLLSAGIVIIIAFVVALALRRKSLYEEQVERLVANSGFKENGKAISKKLKVQPNSVLIGKRVSDIFFAQSLDISYIKRDGKKVVSDSETRFALGDEIEFIYQEAHKDETERFLHDITK